MSPSRAAAIKLKYFLADNRGGVWGDDPDGAGDSVVLRSTEQTSDGRWQIRDPAMRSLTAGERRRFRLANGDVLVTKSSGSETHIGKATLVGPDVAELEPAYSNFMQRLRPGASLDSAFLWYVLQSDWARQQLALFSTTTTGLGNITGTQLGLIELPNLSVREQRGIVDYLDRETAQIDSFITKNEELITLLAERRAATVNEPFASEQPNARLQHACEAVVDCPHTTPEVDDDGTFEAVRTSSVRGGEYVRGQGLAVSEATWCSRNGSLGPRRGDVLFTREAPAGEACMVPSAEICLGQRMVLLRIKAAKADGEFLLWQLYSRRVQSYFELSANGSTVTNIRLPLLRSAPIWLPNLEEQRRVSVTIRQRVDAIDDAIGIARRGVTLARERRAALISAAVTGKIDVREAA